MTLLRLTQVKPVLSLDEIIQGLGSAVAQGGSPLPPRMAPPRAGVQPTAPQKAPSQAQPPTAHQQPRQAGPPVQAADRGPGPKPPAPPTPTAAPQSPPAGGGVGGKPVGDPKAARGEQLG
jgi:hypothetical protein